jgi:hypothetical protein
MQSTIQKLEAQIETLQRQTSDAYRAYDQQRSASVVSSVSDPTTNDTLLHLCHQTNIHNNNNNKHKHDLLRVVAATTKTFYHHIVPKLHLALSRLEQLDMRLRKCRQTVERLRHERCGAHWARIEVRVSLCRQWGLLRRLNGGRDGDSAAAAVSSVKDYPPGRLAPSRCGKSSAPPLTLSAELDAKRQQFERSVSHVRTLWSAVETAVHRQTRETTLLLYRTKELRAEEDVSLQHHH